MGVPFAALRPVHPRYWDHSTFLSLNGRSDKARTLVQVISQTATGLRARPHLHILKDEPDNRILECALLAHADFLSHGGQSVVLASAPAVWMTADEQKALAAVHDDSSLVLDKLCHIG